MRDGSRPQIEAVGFDLGETLIGYDGVGLDWRAHYSTALTRAAEACGMHLSNQDLVQAERILLRYNTREHPRVEEFSAERIFGEILETWNRAGSPPLDAALDAFFGYFQRRVLRFQDVESCLSALAARGVPIGILTDVPYGMPRRFVEADLASAGIADKIDVVVTSVDVGHRKPHAEGISSTRPSVRFVAWASDLRRQ